MTPTEGDDGWTFPRPTCEAEGCTNPAIGEVGASLLTPGVGTFLCREHLAPPTEGDESRIKIRPEGDDGP